MSSPETRTSLRPIVPATIRSDVIGDFQDPYEAIVRVKKATPE
jgi:hypothetical protein